MTTSSHREAIAARAAAKGAGLRACRRDPQGARGAGIVAAGRAAGTTWLKA